MISEKTTQFIEKPQQLFIDNQWVYSDSKETFDSINPATGEIITKLSLANKNDVNQAVNSCRKAFETTWSKQITPAQRGILLWKLADLIERDKKVLEELETLDNGKPLNKAAYDIEGTINHFRYYAGWATKIEGNSIPVNVPNKAVYTQREAIGVIGLIVPWNFPLMITAWKLAPALACGNCCVLKPAEQTSLTALYLGKLIKEAGFPAGVVNIVTGFGNPTGEAITRHMDIDKISFTGSTLVGKKIMQAAADSNLKKVSLELGGKSPNVIFKDADLKTILPTMHWTGFYNSGQECTLGSRLYIERPIFEQVVEEIQLNAKKLTIGNGLKNPDLGPIVSEQQMNTILKYIKTGIDENANLRMGGNRCGGELADGYFVQPTLFTHENEDLTIVKEEIFGPVLTASPFDEFDEVVHKANDTKYGLVAAAWTKDLSKAHQFANAVKAGTIWINGYDLFDPAVPFGGFKQSGIGKEMGKNAIELFTQEKSVWISF
ncbi:MAG: aldehyde dehydrogenase family protein [Flavobacteriales bacterium]